MRRRLRWQWRFANAADNRLDAVPNAGNSVGQRRQDIGNIAFQGGKIAGDQIADHQHDAQHKSFDVVPDVRKNLFDAVKGGRHTVADGAPHRLQVVGNSGNNAADNGLDSAPHGGENSLNCTKRCGDSAGNASPCRLQTAGDGRNNGADGCLNRVPRGGKSSLHTGKKPLYAADCAGNNAFDGFPQSYPEIAESLASVPQGYKCHYQCRNACHNQHNRICAR